MPFNLEPLMSRMDANEKQLCFIRENSRHSRFQIHFAFKALAFTKEVKSGWGARGLDLNSGWN